MKTKYHALPAELDPHARAHEAYRAERVRLAALLDEMQDAWMHRDGATVWLLLGRLRPLVQDEVQADEAAR